MTQRQLAMTAAVDIKTIYNLESGERWPQAGTRAKIEKALGWSVGTLKAAAEGREMGYQFPTRAELIEDGLRRSRVTPAQVAAFAGISEQTWTELTAASPTIAEARTENHELAQELARVAIYLGITPQQLTEAGQRRAAATLQRIAASAPNEQTSEPADAHLRRLLELWVHLTDRQRRGLVGMLEEMLSESPELAGKPDQGDKRRSG